MTRRAVAFAVALAIAATACAPRRPPVATATDAQRSNIALADLEQGRKLLIGKCTNCHRVPMPYDHSAGEWPARIAEMSQRANLDARQRALIEEYLVTMAQR